MPRFGALRLLSSRRPRVSSAAATLGAFHRASDVDPGAGVELAEHVADVRLDGLLAEKQLTGDLGVGLAVDDQLGDLQLATGQRAHATARVARPGAPVNVLPELTL